MLACVSDDGASSPDRADDTAILLEVGAPESGFEVDASDAAIEGDILTLTLRHGGGCGDHNYRMFWNGSFQKTDPLQASLVIRDETEDFCEALISSRVSFDLSAMGAELGADEVVLIIENYTGEAPTYTAAEPLPGVTVGQAPRDADPFTIDETTLDEGELEVVVRYGGGCEPHEFELFWTGEFIKTDPPQANLALFHNANGDACEALAIETLLFDVSEVTAEPGVVINVDVAAGPAR